jgi:hypothetical protein
MFKLNINFFIFLIILHLFVCVKAKKLECNTKAEFACRLVVVNILYSGIVYNFVRITCLDFQS